MSDRIYTVLCPFGGMGGGALGFKSAEVRLLGVRARFECLGSIDFDADSCRDFEMLTGAPAHCRNVAELTPADLHQMFGRRAPDVVFMSPPCKGASGLLSAAKAKSTKYREMNRLALVWTKLMLEAWGDEPPRLVLLENVPRLKQRAGRMLRAVRSLLHRAGYVFSDGFHECGELGGLAQVRRRYLLVARHQRRVPPLLYKPPPKRVRACGEVLGPLPFPEDPAAGPMHRLPRLSWLNWVRLALIPAGGDWRDLEGVLRDGQPRREVFKRHHVQRWGEPSGTVAGSGSNGPNAVADPRIALDACKPGSHHNKYRVERWEAPAHTVIGADRIGSGAPSIADPRAFKGSLGVIDWQKPTGTVPGESYPTNGAHSVADPRIDERLRVPHAYPHGYGVLRWNEPSSTVAAGSQVGQGAYSVADERYRGAYGVLDWTDPAGTVTGNARPPTGRFSVADIRFNCEMRAGTYGVLSWEEAAKTITGHANVGNITCAVADPRKPPAQLPIIIAADGTWHRPLTTLELAVLQGFPALIDDKPLTLTGSSSSKWRERIGNAVPPPAARAIAEQMLVTLVHADANAFSLSGSLDVWVEPEELTA